MVRGGRHGRNTTRGRTCTSTPTTHTPPMTFFTHGLNPVSLDAFTRRTNKHNTSRNTLNVASCSASPKRRTLVPMVLRSPFQFPLLAMPLPEHWVKKEKTSDVMKIRPSHRGDMPKNTCCGPSGKLVRIRRVRSRYKVAQTKIGEMTT